ncbi:thioesterase family protein [Pedobacter sp. SYSU D00535]|uniref:acyl-CoA thioesterase n=1 Tax=Pedobacter sp. SYSU D00535 TaxID=2810308 RepID=UPI001A95DD2A|nr:thioesterase family protein [Pedobacter sp. SYSU D00535]
MDINSYNYKTYIPVRFGDLNAFGYVNNDVYLTYFEIAHTGYWRQILNWKSKTHGLIMGKAEIEFLKPIQLDDEVFAYVKTSRVGNCSFDVEYVLTIKTPSGEQICTTGKTSCIFFDFEAKKPNPIPEAFREKMVAFEALVS